MSDPQENKKYTRCHLCKRLASNITFHKPKYNFSVCGSCIDHPGPHFQEWRQEYIEGESRYSLIVRKEETTNNQQEKEQYLKAKEYCFRLEPPQLCTWFTDSYVRKSF